MGTVKREDLRVVREVSNLSHRHCAMVVAIHWFLVTLPQPFSDDSEISPCENKTLHPRNVISVSEIYSLGIRVFHELFTRWGRGWMRQPLTDRTPYHNPSLSPTSLGFFGLWDK